MKSAITILKSQKKALQRVVRREKAQAKKLARLRDDVSCLASEAAALADTRREQTRAFYSPHALDAE